ncbi:MAG: hypothetical protein HQM11_09845 [SAR324 cluster bacterium]|nr:hypothetical protein [SAR324 cluster bacterium]
MPGLLEIYKSVFKDNRKLPHRLALRLITRTLLFSALITLIIVSLELYTEFSHDKSIVEAHLKQIERTAIKSITQSLWNMDPLQLKLQMEGILSEPDIVYIEIREINRTPRFTVGIKHQTPHVSTEFPLIYEQQIEDVNANKTYVMPMVLGNLYVEASLDTAFQQTKDRVALLLVAQTLKTLLVSIFIFFLFYNLVGRHLSVMADYARALNIDKLEEPLRLHRSELSAGTDELDDVVIAFNEMLSGLKQATLENQQLNAELERRVRDRTTQLEVTNAELEAFSYSVSHDLRAPLRHISGFMDLLKQRSNALLDEKGQHYIKVIEKSAQEMEQLIDHLLNFSRMGKTEMKMIPLKMEWIVKDVLNNFQQEQEGRHIEWKISPLPEVRGDRLMITQVWVNLISNALKYTSHRVHAVIEIGCFRQDNETVFYIKDNGAGFDMRYVDKLFGVFQRLHNATEFEGTGIGLANVRRIIHRHGGEIRAEGIVDQGATFYFTLGTNC